MTTTEISRDEVLAFFAALPENIQDRYASRIRDARNGELTQATFFQIKRQIVGAVSAPMGEEAKRQGRPTSNASNHTPNPASEAQVRFVTRLVATKVGGSEYAAEVAKGLSKVRASAIIDILSGRADAVVDESNQATPAQVRFLNSLRVERGSEELTEAQVAQLSRKQASAEIEAWKLIPRPAKPVLPVGSSELEAGIYRLEDKFYKVQRAVHGSGRMYAKVLVVDGPGAAHFEYADGAIRKLTADNKIDLEEAKQFGHVYGVCCNCGATLTDEDSIEAGIGPVCAKKAYFR